LNKASAKASNFNPVMHVTSGASSCQRMVLCSAGMVLHNIAFCSCINPVKIL